MFLSRKKEKKEEENKKKVMEVQWKVKMEQNFSINTKWDKIRVGIDKSNERAKYSSYIGNWELNRIVCKWPGPDSKDPLPLNLQKFMMQK